jgi:hypothetical protein
VQLNMSVSLGPELDHAVLEAAGNKAPVIGC